MICCIAIVRILTLFYCRDDSIVFQENFLIFANKAIEIPKMTIDSLLIKQKITQIKVSLPYENIVLDTTNNNCVKFPVIQ